MIDLNIIDTHLHYSDEHAPHWKELTWMAGRFEEVTEAVRTAGVRTLVFASPFSSIESSLVPAEQIMKSNDTMLARVSREPDCYCWCVLQPLYREVWRQEEQMIRERRCVGLKLGSSLHGYRILSAVGREILAFLDEHAVPGLFHSYSEWDNPMDFATLARERPRAKFIVAHAGHSWPFMQHIEAVEAARDTGLHIGIDQPQYATFWGLLEHTVERIGSGRMVYGSDTPCHLPGVLIDRVRRSKLPDEDKRMILGGTAKALLGEKLRCP